MFTGAGHIWKDLKKIMSVILHYDILFPLIFTILISSIPSMNMPAIYILTNIAGWSYLDMSLIQLIFGLVYFLLLGYIVNKLQKVKMETLSLAGSAAIGLLALMNFSLLLVRSTPYWIQFVIQTLFLLLSSFSADLPSIAIIGRFSERCPKGLETTGTTLLVSIGLLSTMINGVLKKF